MRLSPRQGVTRGGQRPPEKQAGERSKACRPPRTPSPRRSRRNTYRYYTKISHPQSGNPTRRGGQRPPLRSRQASEAKPADRHVHLRLGADRRTIYRYHTAEAIKKVFFCTRIHVITVDLFGRICYNTVNSTRKISDFVLSYLFSTSCLFSKTEGVFI